MCVCDIADKDEHVHAPRRATGERMLVKMADGSERVESQKSLGSTAVIQPMGQGGSRSPCSYILASLNWFPSPNRSKIAPVCVCTVHANLQRFLRAADDVKQFSEAKM